MPNLAENLDKKEADQEELIQAEVVQPEAILVFRYQRPKKASKDRARHLTIPGEVEDLDKKERRPGRNRDRSRKVIVPLTVHPTWRRTA